MLLFGASFGFAGFLCYSELAALKESDFRIFPMEISYCKTDQHRDGAWIVAHTVTKIYPVFPLGESDLQLFH